jgi:hypothetical protein
MPSRWVCIAIVAFWLATSGWLLWHEVWPEFRPNQPPTFSIDLVDEVELEKNPEVAWSVWVGGRDAPPDETDRNRSFHAFTSVHRESADLYTLQLRLTAAKNEDQRPVAADIVPVESMSSSWRVNAAGQLRGLDASVKVVRRTVTVVASFHGEVRDGRLYGRYVLTTTPDVPLPFRGGDLDPMPLTQEGTMIQPLHPAQRIRGLYPGQTWRVPSLDLLGGTRIDVHYLEARVRPAPEGLLWRGRERSCWVIEYAGEDEDVRTWVEQEGGLVLRQEALVEGKLWVLRRDH